MSHSSIRCRFRTRSPIPPSAARDASWGRPCNRHVCVSTSRQVFPLMPKRPQFDPVTGRPLTHLEPQSRCGDKPLKFQVVCPQNGTAVLKGLTTRQNHYNKAKRDLDAPKKDRPPYVWHLCTLSRSKYVGTVALPQSSTYLVLLPQV